MAMRHPNFVKAIGIFNMEMKRYKSLNQIHYREEGDKMFITIKGKRSVSDLNGRAIISIPLAIIAMVFVGFLLSEADNYSADAMALCLIAFIGVIAFFGFQTGKTYKLSFTPEKAIIGTGHFKWENLRQFDWGGTETTTNYQVDVLRFYNQLNPLTYICVEQGKASSIASGLNELMAEYKQKHL